MRDLTELNGGLSRQPTECIITTMFVSNHVGNVRRRFSESDCMRISQLKLEIIVHSTCCISRLFSLLNNSGKDEMTENLVLATRSNCLECMPTISPKMAGKVSSSWKFVII